MSEAQSTSAYDRRARDYDAVLVVSFGGPEGPDDVIPFLDNVLRGLPIEPDSKQRIAERYQQFGGVSPINAHTREFISALQRSLGTHGPTLPVYWGNRNWHPMLADTVRQMKDDGIERAIAYVTSVFSSYSGCRRYREDLFQATSAIEDPPIIDKLRLGFNHPGFIEAAADRITEAFAQIPGDQRARTPILFTAHSLPHSMARHSPYEAQLNDCCQLVGDALEHQRWQLVFQSNNASYGREAWLGPDICDAIKAVKSEGADHVVVAPIGFVCDHMEVVLDLDVEAASVADEVGLHFVRAGTVGAHPAYVECVRDLIVERMSENPVRKALGELGPSHDYCPETCCLSGRPGPAKPSLCGLPEA